MDKSYCFRRIVNLGFNYLSKNWCKILIIDAHAHIGKLSPIDREVDAEFIMKVINRLGVDKICVSSSKALFYNFFEGNQDVLKAVKQFPDRILGYSVINPRYGIKAMKEFERCIGEGMIGLKLHGPLHMYPIDEPAVYPLIENAIKFKVPILIHAEIDEINHLAEVFPEATIIMAHMGAGGDYLNGLWIAKKHENIIVDTCSSTIDAGMVERAVEIIGADRIVYGSDIPWLDPYTQMAKVTTAKIKDEDKRLILGENMARLLRLKGV